MFVIDVLMKLRFTTGGSMHEKAKFPPLLPVAVAVADSVASKSSPLSSKTIGTHSFFTATEHSCAPSFSTTPAAMTSARDTSRFVGASPPPSIDDSQFHTANAPTDAIHPEACIAAPTRIAFILSHPSAFPPSHGDARTRASAQVRPKAAGAAREPGLHFRRRRGAANSQHREPRRLAVAERRILLAWTFRPSDAGAVPPRGGDDDGGSPGGSSASVSSEVVVIDN